MKRKKFFLLSCMVMLSAMNFVSCSSGDSSDDSDSGNSGTTSGSYLTSEQQKEKIKNVGEELVNNIPASQFQDIKDIIVYFSNTYTKNYYENDEVNSWYNDCLSSLVTVVQSNNLSQINNVLYDLSKFTGHFTANTSTKKWVYKEASDLQFSFKDKSGNDCILSLTTSGSKKKVYIKDDVDQYYTNKVIYEKNYANIPEHITVNLTQKNNTLASITVNTDLSSISKEQFDFDKDSYSASTIIKAGNTTINLTKVAYSANSTASAELTVYNNKTQILSMSASAANVNINKINDNDISDLKKANINIDILNKIQIKGSCSDIYKLQTYLQQADKNHKNENTYKSYVNQANSLLDLGLYFNSDVKQAYINLEPTCEKYSYLEYWYCEPVIRFSDGTSYSTFEAFFDKTTFNDLINSFNNLVTDYQKLTEE